MRPDAAWWIAGFAVLAVAAVAVALARRRYVLVAVTGDSMLPTLAPGDRVLVRRHRRPRAIVAGELVVARKPAPGHGFDGPPRPPGEAGALLIKRAAWVSPSGEVLLLGDNPHRSWDSRQWGLCPPRHIVGVVVRVPPSAATAEARLTWSAG